MNPLEELKHHIESLKTSFNSGIVFGVDGIGITQYTFWMVICLTAVVLIVVLAGKRLTLVPKSKFAGMVEMGYNLVRKDIGESTIGHGFEKHTPFLATVFFFILICNFTGLIPGMKTPTGTISVTWALSLCSFTYFVFWGVKTKGGLGYLKSLVPHGLPLPVVPVVWFLEFFSTMLRLVTLAVRLYGNMFAGHTILGVFGLLTSVFVTAAIANANFVMALPSVGWLLLLTAMYMLETMVAFLQAYVFTILSAVYISLATSDH